MKQILGLIKTLLLALAFGIAGGFLFSHPFFQNPNNVIPLNIAIWAFGGLTGCGVFALAVDRGWFK